MLSRLLVGLVVIALMGTVPARAALAPCVESGHSRVGLPGIVAENAIQSNLASHFHGSDGSCCIVCVAAAPIDAGDIRHIADSTVSLPFTVSAPAGIAPEGPKRPPR
jgi:hypothetical protein